jgi:hypothetical protein
VRAVETEKPAPSAQAVTPTLEDAYLLHIAPAADEAKV